MDGKHKSLIFVVEKDYQVNNSKSTLKALEQGVRYVF